MSNVGCSSMVEPLDVNQDVAGSNPVGHPNVDWECELIEIEPGTYKLHYKMPEGVTIHSVEAEMNTDIGLAMLKQQGYLMDYEGNGCPALSEEFDEHFRKMALPWYLRMFEKKIHSIAREFWDNALIETVRNG